MIVAGKKVSLHPGIISKCYVKKKDNRHFKAMERKTGARSLRGVMEDIMNPIMFRIPDEQDIEKLVIDTDKDDNIKIDKKKKEAAA